MTARLARSSAARSRRCNRSFWRTQPAPGRSTRRWPSWPRPPRYRRPAARAAPAPAASAAIPVLHVRAAGHIPRRLAECPRGAAAHRRDRLHAVMPQWRRTPTRCQPGGRVVPSGQRARTGAHRQRRRSGKDTSKDARSTGGSAHGWTVSRATRSPPGPATHTHGTAARSVTPPRAYGSATRRMPYYRPAPNEPRRTIGPCRRGSLA